MSKATPKDVLQAMVDAVARAGGNKAQAAKDLGLPPMTLKNRLEDAALKGVKPKKELVTDSPGALKMQVRQLEAELKREKERSITEAAIRRRIVNLGEECTRLEIPAWTLPSSHRLSSPGVPTLFLSDLHWGEVVNQSQVNGVNKYNVAISHQRIKTLVGSTLHLLKILSPKMDYPGIVVPLGGDMISGNIHDELTATNEMNTMPTVLDLYGVLVWLILELLKHLPRVFLPCVTGNHGRDTQKIWGKDRHATSFDWLLYMFLAKRFEGDKRVVFFVPDGSDALYKVYDHKYLLTHGDQFRGGDGMIGALGPIIRGDHKKRSRNAQIDMEYDTMILGHWHQYIHLTRLIVNGSLKGYDEYAYQNSFGFEEPQQALWINHPDKGITWRMPVFVQPKAARDQRDQRKSAEWVAFSGAANVVDK